MKDRRAILVLVAGLAALGLLSWSFVPSWWAGLLVGVLGAAVGGGLCWWRGKRGGDEICWVHYERFRPGGRCRVCGLRGGFTGVRRVVAVLDSGRAAGKWEVLDVRLAGVTQEGTYECEGDPEAWDADGILRVNWLQYGKPLAFEGVEIMRATDAEVESFVQHSRFKSAQSVREGLGRMTCVLGPAALLSANTQRVLQTTFGRVASNREATKMIRRPPSRRRFPICSQTPLDSMVWIDPGTFLMGSPSGEANRGKDEGPQTGVTLSKGYWFGKYEVTQREWGEVMGSNPSHFKAHPDLPVESVSWYDAMDYCCKLTERQRMAGRLPPGYVFRLPTEAQWEYACRAGTSSATALGERLNSMQANFDGSHPNDGAGEGSDLGGTVKVGSYLPNGWGLYDMHGNVWEWCLDWYQDRLPGGSVVDPTGPSTGSSRVFRGGSWDRDGRSCRSAHRYCRYPEFRSYNLGFRLALVSVP